MKYFLLSFLILSCASRPKELREMDSQTEPRKSLIVLFALKASGLVPKKIGQTEVYRAEGVSCLRDLGLDVWNCGFLNTGRQYAIPTIQSSALSGVLMNLPVPKGESGMATSFIECRMFDGDPENAVCDVAISLDLPGP